MKVSEPTPGAVGPSIRESSQVFPATFAQQRLWFLDQLQPGAVTYLIPWSIRMTGALDAAALERSLNEVVRRHKILRTTFSVMENEVVQVVAESLLVPLPVEDLRQHANPEEEAQRLASEEAQQPLDLVNGPLVRARLLQLDADRHILLLTLHHIIFDGSSRAVLTSELAALYDAFRSGNTPALPEPRLQYCQYAKWQRRSVQGKRYADLLAYWKQRLADLPAALALPADRPRPAIEAFHGAVKFFTLPQGLSAATDALAKRSRASLFMTLLAAFQGLMSKYSGQEDIVVGVPIAGRGREELAGVIGLLANELAVRVDLSGNPTFEEMIARVRDVALDAYEHQDMPFDKLVQELNPERSLSQNPLFQVMFSLRNYHREELQLAGLDQVSISVTEAHTAKFDLSMYITQAAEGLSGWVEYNTDLFDGATIDRLLGHYEVLLEAAVGNPGLRLSELPLLTPPEKHQVLVGFNDTFAEYPRDRSLHQFIEEQVELTPDAPALIFDSTELSYWELNARANQLAHYLRTLGVGPEALVAVCAERSLEMVIALVAILKAGGAYVPIDPDYPAERLAVMLEDAEPKAVLTLQRLLHVLPPHGVPTLCLDTDWSTLADQPTSNPASLTTGANAAYVIYTSGSTGKPKGVVNIHSGIVNRLLWMQSAYGLKAGDAILQKTPYSFDVSVWEFFWPLMTGACLVIARPEGHKDPNYLVDLIVERKITTMHFVPSMLRIFLETDGAERCNSLRRVICSGEALSLDLEERFFEKLGAELDNLYGPTEASVDVTYWRCAPHSGRSVVPIGRPIWNTQIYILDANLQPVPVGVPGELHIGGAGLARGYLKRPELTAEKFITEPFSRQAGARLYKTGDLARLLSDGTIEYLGRIDFQVKIRGFRIELGEIEAVLSQHPDVKECAVIAREDVADDRRLAAYVVSNAEDGVRSGSADSDLSAEQVSNWATTFDESYRYGGDAADATFNIAGWNSSYTGQAIPAEEMRVWVETTVNRILALHRNRVWEIGCGTGLLLFRIAPKSHRYHGTDVSETALSFLRQQLRNPRLNLPQVTLDRKPAHEIVDAAQNAFDLVVLNSVIQYFPNREYLTDVLKAAVESLDSQGAIFIGDVRSLPLLKTFHTSVQLHRAPDTMSCDHLLQRAEMEMRQEGELVVDPEFFLALSRQIPSLSRVEIQLKRGKARNELTRFRYDVILHLGNPPAKLAGIEWIDWGKQGLSLPLLREILQTTEPLMLGLTGIPNARLAADIAATKILESEDRPATVGELRRMLSEQAVAASWVEPEDLWRLEEEFPYRVEIRASRKGRDGLCDVLLRHKSLAAEDSVAQFPGSVDSPAGEKYVNNPLRQKLLMTLVPRLRIWLGEKLPEYMVPSAFVLLDSMPLSPNGKVNRKALPRPEYAREESVAYIAPRTPVEIQLAAIWSEVLHIPQIGVADNFFALGGHSLLGTQAISRIRDAFQVDLPLRALFEAPTVAGLAEQTEALLRENSSLASPPLHRMPHDGAPPLSFAQQRLWFLDQMDPGNALYNMPSIVRLRGALQMEALHWSLQEIVRRHEALRTRFEVRNGEPVQVVDGSMPLPFAVADIAGFPEYERELEARRIAGEEAERPFHLATGPLVRALLIRLTGDDHVLVVNTHHIVSDGWSLGVLWRELTALYPAFLDGAPSPLPELAVQYSDFSIWQRQYLAGEQLEKQLSYWKRQLAGVPPLELPTDRTRPAVETFRGGRQSLLLPAGLLEDLKYLSRREGVTLFMTLLGAFSALLSRYSGQQDIVVGFLTSGRNRPEIEDLVGFFVNALVMRTSLEGNPTFRQVMARACETALGADANQDVPFEKLVEELQPVRDLSRNPLFQVMLAMQNMPGADQTLPNVAASPFLVRKTFSKFDLTLFVVERPEGLRTTIEYNTDLFDSATIDRMLGHLQVLLEAVANNPGLRLSELPLLTAPEKHQILAEFNNTFTDYPRARSLHQFIEEQVEVTPEAPALIFDSTELSYRELNSRANQLAHYLRTLGVGPEALVAVCAERSLEMVIALVAILKAGGAYVPIDPDYPAERLAVMLEDAEPKAVLTLQRLLHVLPQHGVPTLCLDTDWPTLADQPTSNPALLTTGANAAYVIYTSGSTGKPKGVVNIHSGIVNRLLWMQSAYGLNGGDAVLQKTPYSFDVSVWEFFWPLMTGACLVIARPEGHKDPNYLVDLIVERKITTMHFVPSMLRIFLETDGAERCNSLRRVICSGEALSLDLEERFFEKLGAELDNLYGPTEASVDVTYWQCAPHSGRSVVPIGRPIWNTQIYILDANLQPVPVGVPGELHIGGAGLARGYLKRPELTAEKFITDPFSRQAGARLYKTGDLARLLSDGTIEYLGRIDFQVKIRGFRIELGEIEAVLGQQPEVKECVVVARDEQLVAYLVARDGGELSTAELRKRLQAHLPDYMVPAAFVYLPFLPLSANGKVDRRALPAPDLSSRSAGHLHIAPRTPAEEMLAAIWADVLKLERVSVEDNFFELGGHSLLATRVVSRIRNAFRVDLPLRDLFEEPTVAGLAKRIEVLIRQDRGLQAPPLKRADRGRPLPLSFAQQRLWFIDQLEPGNPIYNIAKMARLRGAIQADALERALNEVVRRHEVLRTSFVTVDGQPVQVISPELKLTLPIVDLSHLSEIEREAEVTRFATEEAQRPFDLAKGPLLQSFLLRLAPDCHIFFVNMHHIATERWSQGLMWSEIGTLYDAFIQGKPSPLPELTIQYADFAAWQREWLQGEPLERQLAYWRTQLAGAPPVLELPTDRHRPAMPRHRGATQVSFLSPALVQRLSELSRSEDVTLFMTLLAAFQTLLSRYSGQKDIVVGSTIAGRNYAEIEPLIGFFVNTIALRTDLSGDPTFRSLLRRVKEVALNAYAHQDIPFEKLVEELSPERSLSYNPIFQVAIVQDQAIRSLELPGLKLEGLPLHQGTAVFDITWYVVEMAEGVRLFVEYDTDLFDRGTIERMLGHHQVLLEAAVDNPHLRLSELPLLTAAEEHQLLFDWNEAQSALAPERCIQEIFESQVSRTPDNVAVIFEGLQLTYKELNERSNQLAHRLLGLGAGPEILVAICVEPSLEMLVAILAVLKAGAGYLPLDPAYPPERLEFTLQDAQAPILITATSLKAQLPPYSGVTICLDAEWSSLTQEPGGNSSAEATPENVAYVIYTSGSTGKPKGVVVTHGNVSRLFTSTDDWFGFGPSDVWTLFHSFAFDFSVWEIWGALLFGGTLVVVPRLTAKSPEQFHELLVQNQVTVLNQTPSGFRSLIAADRQSALTGKLALRYVIFGGETLEFRTLLPWIERHGAKPALINMYGITETTVHVTYFKIAPDSVNEGTLSLIGKRIPDLQVYVLDESLKPVPIGVLGELYVGGRGVARGYLSRPELTAERFIDNPFQQHPGRLYKTGDLARFQADGNMQYLGRIDHQVKIRGFRIELGEIEAVLAKHSAIKECVVVALEDRTGDKSLVAYIGVREERQIPVAELRNLVKAHLPEYMVPSAFVQMAALPLTSNGKVDRKALPAPDPVRSERAGEDTPQTPVEELVCAIFSDILHLDRVGTEDNFFDLGGHSLSATQAVARIRRALQMELPLRVLFEAPIVAALAGRIEQLQRSGRGLAALPIVAVPRNRHLPLSFAQQRLWFMAQLDPENPLYNVPLAIRLKGCLDIQALQVALDRLVERHEVLRTTYEVEGDQPVQVVNPAAPVECPLIDLSVLPPAARAQETEAILGREKERPFHLAVDPILRTLLLKLDSEEHILLLGTHHIASDGWSNSILMRELTAFYSAAVGNAQPDLPELPVQYADYAVWQRNWLQGETLRNELSFWRDVLAGAPPVLQLPTDRPRPTVQTHRGGTHTFVAAVNLMNAIRILGRQEGATSFMTMLAAFQILLYHFVKQPDIVLGTDLANRTTEQTEALIGFFVNLVVLRTDLSGDPSFLELLGRVRHVALEAYAHQDLPFDKLVEELQPERSRSHNALVQVLFVQQNTPRGSVEMSGIEISGIRIDLPSKFDMAVFVRETAEGIVGVWQYNADLFDAATVERMAEMYQAVLARVTAQPDSKLSEITESLAEWERQRRTVDNREFEEASRLKLQKIKRRASIN